MYKRGAVVTAIANNHEYIHNQLVLLVTVSGETGFFVNRVQPVPRGGTWTDKDER